MIPNPTSITPVHGICEGGNVVIPRLECHLCPTDIIFTRMYVKLTDFKHRLNVLNNKPCAYFR